MRFLAILLAAALLLGGCSYLDSAFGYEQAVPYSEMQYTRPDLEAIANKAADVCAFAETCNDASALMTAIYGFYDVYDSYLTDWYLADLHYSADLSDSYWEEEYNFCAENASQLDAALEQLYMTLAHCPIRNTLEAEYFGIDYFDAYEGKAVLDETYLALLEEEARLENEYYDLSDKAMALGIGSQDYYEQYTEPMARLLAELVAIRQEMAAYLGYESYADFAYYGSYYRSYTPEDALSYLISLRDALLETYVRLEETGLWEYAGTYSDSQETFAYLKEAATNMGGTVKYAFDMLEAAQLYDIGYGENKYDSSFALYLWRYEEPFIFMNPWLDQTDKLTLAHEFGHFVSDYVCYGSYAGTDVAEVHSQAMEYLSLCYTKNTESLARYKLADSLCTFLECGAYALFEHRLYDLTPEELTAENIMALYQTTCSEFGFESWDWDSRDFISIVHFFTEPMYMISYLVSNDLAIQFYQMEQTAPGAGLALYEQILQSEDSDIIAFAEAYGLENPFATGRPAALAETFAEIIS
jgi:hypothetical protein